MTATRPEGVVQAFEDLESAPLEIQGLLRPVLVKALHDPALMRHLGASALSEHLAVLGRILINLPTEGVGPSLPPLQTFIHLSVGEDVDDVEEAYDYVHSLDAPLRARVEGGLSRALQNRAARSGKGTISLLALARLLALAFSNLPFVAHVLDGGPIEPFLPRSHARAPAERLEARAPAPEESSAEVASTSRHLARFVDEFVEVIAIVNEGGRPQPVGHVFVTIGRVIEISPTHVLLETLRGHAARLIGGQRVLLGMAHVVAMRMLSTDDSVAGRLTSR